MEKWKKLGIKFFSKDFLKRNIRLFSQRSLISSKTCAFQHYFKHYFKDLCFSNITWETPWFHQRLAIFFNPSKTTNCWKKPRCKNSHTIYQRANLWRLKAEATIVWQMLDAEKFLNYLYAVGCPNTKNKKNEKKEMPHLWQTRPTSYFYLAVFYFIMFLSLLRFILSLVRFFSLWIYCFGCFSTLAPLLILIL